MICAHGGEGEEIELVNSIKQFDEPEDAYLHVKTLKNEGNCLFKMAKLKMLVGIMRKLLSFSPVSCQLVIEARNFFQN